MRRLFTCFAAVVAMVSLLVGCSKETKKGDYKCAVPNDAGIVVRFDINKVLVKSGLKSELTNMLRNKLRQSGAPEMLVKFADDLRNTGIDVEAPMYLFVKEVNDDVAFYGLIAKVYEKDLLDKLAGFIPDALKSSMSGCTVVSSDDSVALGYNDTAVMLGMVVPIKPQYNDYGDLVGVSLPNVKTMLVGALKDAANRKGGALLPAYEGSDVAVCMSYDNMSSFMKLGLEQQEGALNRLFPMEALRAYVEKTLLEPMKNGRMDCALSFEDGCICLDAKMTGNTKWANILKPCSNENLDNVSADALVVANVAIDGEEYLKLVDEMISWCKKEYPNFESEYSDYLAKIGMRGLTFDDERKLLGSINGDVTLAINNIKPVLKDDAMTADVDACAMAKVTNPSIMNALENSSIANTPEVIKLDDHTYTANTNGVNVYFGQQGDLFYASTPSMMAPKSPNVTSASWYPEVQGSKAYAVVNFSSLFSIPEVKQALCKSLADKFGYGSEYNAAVQLVESLDYLLFTAPTFDSVNLTLALKNKKENALKQIVDRVKSAMY